MPSSAAPILITGGAQRIGLHCALRLLESGQPVIVSYRSEREGLAELRERGATTLVADFASEAGILDFIARLKDHTDSLRAIVHIGDDVTRTGSAKRPAYCASKAGLDSLTLSFAARFAPAIKVNGIAPALIQFNPDDSAEYRAKRLAESAVGIEPGAEVIYQSLRYLLDNPYVTGTTLTVNGGRHLV